LLFDYCLSFDVFFSRMVISVASTFKFDVVGWVDASTVISFCNVDFFFASRGFDVDLSIPVAAIVVSVPNVAAVSSDALAHFAKGNELQENWKKGVMDRQAYSSLVISTSEWSL